ncbi:MAG TPA: hypothetical protein VIK92_04690, partial [Thermaerobacter sp.]
RRDFPGRNVSPLTASSLQALAPATPVGTIAPVARLSLSRGSSPRGRGQATPWGPAGMPPR